MPGVRTTSEPATASESSVSDEASQLELHLQHQLEEDIARIFDESIYSDLELVCGKLKILTHSCILKARTSKFYHKIQTILHVDIEKTAFDEIYSFISDAYTECNIKHQEVEIITYLEDNLNAVGAVPNKKQDTEEADVFATPISGLSPFAENTFQTVKRNSSTDITKEYYALVPIERHLLDKELNEQDVLSKAFQSINKTQTRKVIKSKESSSKKPTSLSLSSSHFPKTVKHSSKSNVADKQTSDINNSQKDSECKIYFIPSQANETRKKIDSCETAADTLDSTFSPDSLVTELDQSSSSDYLSAAYNFSPGNSHSGYPSQLNVENNCSGKMENVFTSSDSGLENTGLLESLSSHKDVTLTDVSFSESTLHDFTTDDTNVPVESEPDSANTSLEFFEQMSSQPNNIKSTLLSKSSKEEKQRHNEEIVILESSSLSSETGSWESVFPPKLVEKEVCEKFIANERQHSNKDHINKPQDVNYSDGLRQSLVQKSPFKSTSCFIDAASLVDEEDDIINIQTDLCDTRDILKSDILPAPSQPVPCSSSKLDISPSDWSEPNENDSLEQNDNKDPDSIQKDLSPTIFEMTPITEDSLCGNTFENAAAVEMDSKTEENSKSSNCFTEKERSLNTVLLADTPNNSFLSLRSSVLRQYDHDENGISTTILGEPHPNIKLVKKYDESLPIVSGGASIEDHLPSVGSVSGSPAIRRKIENVPIVSGAYIPEVDSDPPRKSPKHSNASAWVVDMSKMSIQDNETATSRTSSVSSAGHYKKLPDRACEFLRNESYSLDNCSKSRSSLDSDSSERSSHKFYIDLSSLPDALPQKNTVEAVNNGEKKNIFSMYIDLGKKSTLKEMPSRLSSSLNAKKISSSETKQVPTKPKTTKFITKESTEVAKSSERHDYSAVFEEYESLCNDPNISISEIINLPVQKSKSIPSTNLDSDPVAEKNQNQESLISDVVKNVSLKPHCQDSFVKLSDLDKPLKPVEPTVVFYEEKVSDVRMTRSIPDNNWGDKVNANGSKSIEVISSFHSENALSLNRLFPHLKNEFSRSMPGSLSARTRSPLRLGMCGSRGDIEEQASDMSEISSVQSSMCRSVVEYSTTEDTSQTSSLIGNCQSRLGQDLLRMFLEEIAPDVIVEVAGRRIKAHKCILSSRCQYFAGILSGGWVESAGNVIVLPPFSFNVVHFALCHIYSGVSSIPDSISIVELATIADMLGLEGLKEAIMFTLKAKYCHHFHKPCTVCTAGVLECFPLSSVYGLDDLYRKCLRWITKHFYKVWPTKAFATLPKELLDKCYQQHIVNFSIDNLVDTVFGCGIIVATLQNSRWAETVARMCRRLVNAAAHFAAPRLLEVLQALAPLSPDTSTTAKQALDDCLTAAIEWAPPDQACKAYAFLSALVKEIRNQHYNFSKPDLITNGNSNKLGNHGTLLCFHASSWRLQCEGALVRAAPRVVGTQAFKDLPPDLRKRLRELGCIMYGAQALLMSSSLLVQDRKSSPNRNSKSNNSSVTRSVDIDHVRASFVPYAAKPTSAPLGSVDTLKSNTDLRDKKYNRPLPPKVRTTKAQEERAKFNLSKNTPSKDRNTNKVTGTRAVSVGNTKPKYLDPKIYNDGDKDKRVQGPKKLVPKVISSTESSRNSSPVLARSVRARQSQPFDRKAQAMSQDSLATSSRPRTAEPSTDSLSESQASNKYATYTKIKHTTKGSIETVSPSKQQTRGHPGGSLKTKIPVSLKQNAKGNSVQVKLAAPLATKTEKSEMPLGSVVRKKTDRGVPGSLMNATKSSSAKIVPKVVKERNSSKGIGKSIKRSGNTKKPEDTVHPPEIPVMERSGTFLKDEPTFGDKMTNIDIEVARTSNL